MDPSVKQVAIGGTAPGFVADASTNDGWLGDPLGFRRGELFALRWKDIDEHARLLTVREAVYDGMFNAEDRSGLATDSALG